MNIPCEHVACAGCMVRAWSVTYQNDDEGGVATFLCPYCRSPSGSLKEYKERDVTNMPFVRDKNMSHTVSEMIGLFFKTIDEEGRMMAEMPFEEMQTLCKEWSGKTSNQRVYWESLRA